VFVCVCVCVCMSVYTYIHTHTHIGGFVLGYIVPRLLGYSTTVSRTVSIETGMQNSALGVVLATRNFADPLTALPCAISATCHSLIGSAFAVN
jgi:bile acid:Na+ symporter, BASS family